MRLEDTLKEQIESLIDWMLEQSELEAPGPPQYQERCLAMKEHAWFLKEICLPKIPSQKIAMATVEGANGILPDRPDNLSRVNGFLRGKGPGTEAAFGLNSDGQEAPSEAAQPS